MENLEEKIKELIIDRLGLIDIVPSDIDSDAPIFDVNEEGKGLNLDSIDALELIVGLTETFKIKHQSDNITALYSVNTIADFIREKIGE